MVRIALLALLWFGLHQAALAGDYDWSLDTKPEVIASSDLVERSITGSSLQGGLVDLRFGHASIEMDGRGHILEYSDQTTFTLNGHGTTAEKLAEVIKGGTSLMAAVRFNPRSGQIGWLDAVGSQKMKAIPLTVEPYQGVAFRPGQFLKISLNRGVAKEHHLKHPTLRVPGMTQGIKFEPTPGGFAARLPLMRGWDWRDIPLYVVEKGDVFRSRSISVSSTSPQITASGPATASDALTKIPCWLELSGPPYLLETAATRLTASGGGKLSRPVTRANRVDFWLEVDGPGTYWVEATIEDKLGREAKKKWPVFVRPD
jgi:hypothetical protein